MIKNKFLALQLLLAACFIGSCSPKENDGPNQSDSITENVQIVCSTDMGDLTTSTRFALEPTTDDSGNKNGADITWTDGEVVKVYTYFIQGGKSKAAAPADMTIKKNIAVR